MNVIHYIIITHDYITFPSFRNYSLHLLPDSRAHPFITPHYYNWCVISHCSIQSIIIIVRINICTRQLLPLEQVSPPKYSYLA